MMSMMTMIIKANEDNWVCMEFEKFKCTLDVLKIHVMNWVGNSGQGLESDGAGWQNIMLWKDKERVVIDLSLLPRDIGTETILWQHREELIEKFIDSQTNRRALHMNDGIQRMYHGSGITAEGTWSNVDEDSNLGKEIGMSQDHTLHTTQNNKGLKGAENSTLKKSGSSFNRSDLDDSHEGLRKNYAAKLLAIYTVSTQQRSPSSGDRFIGECRETRPELLRRLTKPGPTKDESSEHTRWASHVSQTNDMATALPSMYTVFRHSNKLPDPSSGGAAGHNNEDTDPYRYMSEQALQKRAMIRNTRRLKRVMEIRNESRWPEISTVIHPRHVETSTTKTKMDLLQASLAHEPVADDVDGPLGTLTVNNIETGANVTTPDGQLPQVISDLDLLDLEAADKPKVRAQGVYAPDYVKPGADVTAIKSPLLQGTLYKSGAAAALDDGWVEANCHGKSALDDTDGWELVYPDM